MPITPTRLPAKSTPSCGQRPVWCSSPAKRSRPGMSGMRGTERQPVAMIRNAAERRSPSSVVDRPAVARLVEDRLGDARAEPDVAAQIEALGHVLEVAQDLGLAGVALRPRPLLLELARPRVRVRHALDVAARAGVAVPEPGSADAGRLIDHEHRKSCLAQPVQEVQPGDAGTHDDRVEALTGRHGLQSRPPTTKGTAWPLQSSPEAPEASGAPAASASPATASTSYRSTRSRRPSAQPGTHVDSRPARRRAARSRPCAPPARASTCSSTARASSSRRRFGEVGLADWERVVGVNARAPFFLLQGLVDRMPPGSAVIGIASIEADHRAVDVGRHVVGLRLDQGGAALADRDARGRARPAGHPRQRRRARPDPHADDRPRAGRRARRAGSARTRRSGAGASPRTSPTSSASWPRPRRAS